MPRVLPLLLLALLSSCRIEKRIPTGPVKEEEAIRTTILAYYDAALARDSALVAHAVADSVDAAVESGGAWRRFHSAGTWARVVAGAEPVHVGEPSRIDIRAEGGLASAWVQARGPSGGEMTLVALQRVAGAWVITSVAVTPAAGR